MPEAATSAPTYDLLGVRMSVLNIPDAVRRIVEAVQAGRKGYVCVTGMHGIMEARDDAHLQNILNRAFLCTPDGMPTVWFGKAKGHKEMDRVYGPDLMLALMEETRTKPIRHFFYGGAEGVADDLKAKMEARFPGIQIAGTYCPPFRPLNATEHAELHNQVVASQADILWVGLSTPKQERFMAEFLPSLPVKVMLGVGAAFDFHTARAKQAPKWMQRSGLEWFFRLITEPKRLGKRYLTQVPRFAILLGLDRFGLVSHSSEKPEMPAASLWMASWPKVFVCALFFWALNLATSLAIQKNLLALACAGWLLIPLALFLLLVFVLLASSSDERPDRLVPTCLLILTFLSGGVALFGPLATLVLSLIASPAQAQNLARLFATLAISPLGLIAIALIVGFLIDLLRPKVSS